MSDYIVFYYVFADNFELFAIRRSDEKVDLDFLLNYNLDHGPVIYSSTTFTAEVSFP